MLSLSRRRGPGVSGPRGDLSWPATGYGGRAPDASADISPLVAGARPPSAAGDVVLAADLIIDSCADGLMGVALLPKMAASATDGHLRGLRDGRWNGWAAAAALRVTPPGHPHRPLGHHRRLGSRRCTQPHRCDSDVVTTTSTSHRRGRRPRPHGTGSHRLHHAYHGRRPSRIRRPRHQSRSRARAAPTWFTGVAVL